MAVSQPRLLSPVDLAGLPPRVAEAVAQMTAVCRQRRGSERSAEAFEETKRRVRERAPALGCKILGACAESRDDGASRIERAGQSWFRVTPTLKTIMTSLGPVTYRRARYRTGASSASLMPVDASLGLVNDYLTRPAAQLGLMMGHCTCGHLQTNPARGIKRNPGPKLNRFLSREEVRRFHRELGQPRSPSARSRRSHGCSWRTATPPQSPPVSSGPPLPDLRRAFASRRRRRLALRCFWRSSASLRR